MNKIVYPIGIVLLFACKETKQDAIPALPGTVSTESLNDTAVSGIKKETVQQPDHTVNSNKSDTYFAYTKWNTANKEEGNYQKPGLTVQLKSYLDESRNTGGKKVIVNHQEIDFIVSDAYVFTPFVFADGSESLLLLQEEDESGIYGYRFYYFDQEKLITKGILDIAPDNDMIAIHQFIRFKNQRQSILPIILTDQYYDTNLDKIMPSTGYRFSIDKTAR